MTITSNTQNFGTTATEIGTSRGRRKALLVRNPAASGATIYIGGSDVTTGKAAYVVDEGDPTLAITSGDRDSLAGEEWYARTSSGTATGVAVTEV